RVRHTASCHDHNIRVLGQHFIRLRVHPEPEVHVALFRLLVAPIDDADEIAPTVRARGDLHLAAVGRGSFEHDNVVTAHRAYSSRLEPRRAGADDDDLFDPRNSGRLDGLRKLALTPGRGIVNAHCGTRRVDPVKAGVRADAGANIVFPPFL